MFADLLNKEEELALVKTMAHFANADGKITSEEMVLLEGAAAKCGVEADDVLKDVAQINLEETLAPVQTDKSRRIVIQELITIGYADGHFFQVEKDAVNNVASILGVDNDTVGRIETWVQEGVDWSKKGYGVIIEGK